MREQNGKPGPSWRSQIDEAERQVERGSLFTHTALSETAERVTEVESFVYALADMLVAQAVVDQDALRDAVMAVREELEGRGESMTPGLTLRVDPEGTADDVVPVNCAERIHVCKAVCCRLHFPLTTDEVESGRVKWDLGRPYQIRQDATGTCVHNQQTHGCSVYEDRPGVCRRYSCADDKRIWTDFERMQLNDEWIAENLHGTSPRLAGAAMVLLPNPVVRSDRDA